MTHDRTGLLIIRAWREARSPVPLRAQIRLTRDVSTGFERTLTLTEVDAVTQVVRAWLTEILDDHRPWSPPLR